MTDGGTMRCIQCNSQDVSEEESEHEFTYGVGSRAATLCARFPIMTCAECGFQWDDYRGADARDAAIEEFLNG